MAKVKKEINISEIIRMRKYRLAVQQGYKRLLIRVTLWLIVSYLIFSQGILLVRNTGMDMFPSIKDGDLVIANRLVDSYVRDDVVIYKANGTRIIGRIVATPNDTIMLDDSGNLLINGTTQTGEILYPTYAKDNISYPYHIEGNKYFILGDYRTQAKDSRDFGAIDSGDIEGKILTILRRRGI